MNILVQVTTRQCEVCRTDIPADSVDSDCYQCRQHSRMVRKVLGWCRLALLPDTDSRKRSIPLARIGPLTLTHYGRGYWVVNGSVSLQIAKELYADPVGRDLIRVDGHCGCPAPESPWIKWRMPNGREVIATKNKESCQEGLESSMKSYVEVCQNILDTCDFHDDPESIGAIGTVELYHIDGDLGLRVFVDAMIRHGVYVPPIADRRDA